MMGFFRTALQWINSYISGRQQCVCTQSQGSSSWLNTNLGVPQGSVLGPLLFCLYIDNIRDVLDSRCINHILYADNLQVYVQVPKDNLDVGIQTLQQVARVGMDRGRLSQTQQAQNKVDFLRRKSFY